MEGRGGQWSDPVGLDAEGTDVRVIEHRGARSTLVFRVERVTSVQKQVTSPRHVASRCGQCAPLQTWRRSTRRWYREAPRDALRWNLNSHSFIHNPLAFCLSGALSQLLTDTCTKRGAPVTTLACTARGLCFRHIADVMIALPGDDLGAAGCL